MTQRMSSDDLQVRSKGPYASGFTMLPNVMRDVYLPRIGPDAFTLAFVILSWSGADGSQAARLGVRSLMEVTQMSRGRLNAAKASLLRFMGDVFTRVPGVKETCTPETWWVDMSALAALHARHLQESRRSGWSRGPGRPVTAKPVPGTDTGWAAPVPTADTPLCQESTQVLRETCAGNRHTPVPGTDTHKDMGKHIQKEEEETSRARVAPAARSSSSFFEENSKGRTPEGPPRASERAVTGLQTPDRAEGAPPRTAGAVSPSGALDADAGPVSGSGTAQGPRETRQVTGLRKVPGGGVRGTLSRMLGGRGQFETLMDEVPASGVDRRGWLDLDEATVSRVVSDARAASAAGSVFRTALLMGLDRALGAVIGPRSSSRSADRPVPPSYALLGAAPSVAVTAAPSASEEPTGFEVRASWACRSDPSRVVTIVDKSVSHVVLDTGEQLAKFELAMAYRRVD